MALMDESPQIRWYRARTRSALGDALQRVRQDRGATQHELAERIGSSRPTLSRLERGESSQADTILAILAATGYELVVVPRGSRVTVEKP
jgi:transcriptional regulator with XRE-family HTH domain